MDAASMSREARDMFIIATRIAGFDYRELMLEMHRLRPNTDRFNVTTVLNAMQAISDRHKPHPT